MNRKSATFNSEKGQAIVLLVLFIIGLVAITALAVDGGRLYQGRRQAQNGADNAALAGAQAICHAASVSSAALAVAAQNGFNNDGTTNTVTVNHPPSSGPAAGDSDYVEVIILSKQTPAFARLVYLGSFQTTARAVGHCHNKPPEPLGGGAGLLVLDLSASPAYKGTGSSTTTVSGGVFVNSSASSALSLSGGAHLQSDTVDIVGNYSGDPGAISPSPTTGVDPITDPVAALAYPTEPGGSCASYSLTGGAATIDPGLYCSIKVTGSGVLSMNPGIYYLTGDFSSSGTVLGSGVMIFNESGIIQVGGTNFTLSAPTSGTYKGMLFFMSRSNSHVIDVTAGTTSRLTGTLYGAASAINLAGSSTTFVFNSQVIGDTVIVTGSADIVIQYNPANNYLFDPGSTYVELSE